MPLVEPTLGPTVGVTVPASLPTNIPAVTAGGIVAVLDPTPGVGIVRTRHQGTEVEVRVDNQGGALAVRFQPMSAPPASATLPPDTGVARVFSLDIYRYDASTNSAERRDDREKERSSTIVVKWPVSAEDWNATADSDGVAHPDRLVFFRLAPNGDLVKVQTNWAADPRPHGTLTALFVDRSTFMLAVLPMRQRGQTTPRDDRFFSQTGFRVNRDAFWDFFNKRGGVRTFGYPISREFTLLGFDVQMFQRGILQAMPDGGVATMNLLDSGLMPYTRINFSSFPAPDPALISGAPNPSDPDYAARAIEFVQANVPDQWDGLPVNFLRSFMGTVRYEEAFPDGQGEPALVPLLDLELWGLPTSKPAYDPNNGGFAYQRFQRGIMHYDASASATQGLLLADYLKGIMTGKELPPDLEAQARDSRFYRQQDRTRAGHVARPSELANSSLVGAFDMDVPQEVVAAPLQATP